MAALTFILALPTGAARPRRALAMSHYVGTFTSSTIHAALQSPGRVTFRRETMRYAGELRPLNFFRWGFPGSAGVVLASSHGSLIRVIQGVSYGFNSPLAISTQRGHVWVANCVVC